MTKRAHWTIVKYLLAFGVLALVLYSNWNLPNGKGLKDVWRVHVVEGRPVHSDYFFIAGVLIVVSVVITQFRWYVLVRALDLPFSMRDAMRLGWIGFVFNTFLPGAVGGDIVRAAALARAEERRAAAVATVIMDRFVGLWGLVWLVALIGALCWALGLLDHGRAEQGKAIVIGATIVTAISTVFWAALGFISNRRADGLKQRLTRVPRIGGTLSELWQAAWLYRNRQGTVLLAMAITWINQVFSVAIFYYCARTLWDGLPDNPLPTIAEHFLLVPIGAVIAAIPLFPGGAGIGEAGYGGLYAFFGSASANGVLGSLVMRVDNWLTAAVGIVVYQLLRLNQAMRARSSGVETGDVENKPESEISRTAAA